MNQHMFAGHLEHYKVCFLL